MLYMLIDPSINPKYCLYIDNYYRNITKSNDTIPKKRIQSKHDKRKVLFESRKLIPAKGGGSIENSYVAYDYSSNLYIFIVSDEQIY